MKKKRVQRLKIGPPVRAWGANISTFFHSLSARQIGLAASGGVSFLLFLILMAVCSVMGQSQQTQLMAQRWSEKKDTAQISCFFSVGAEVNDYTIQSFEHSLDKALEQASIIQDSPNANARLWADAYSADGKILLESDRAKLEANAIGIGGDFFLFHPLKLLNGSFFSGNDLNQDYCVIDEEAAWQLFGSNDVSGMTVYIGGIPHIVTGVIEREKGRLQEAAGLSSTVVYVSYSTLEAYGTSNGLNHYEIVMPNPVSKYAYNYVKENIGVEEKEVEVVENTTRYSIVERLKIAGAFGSRSMNGKAIIYPYWENVARGYEDILALLTLIALIFLLYAVVLAAIGTIYWAKHKTWTVKSVFLLLKDKAERRMERRREKKRDSGTPRKRRLGKWGKKMPPVDFVDLDEEDDLNLE